MFNKQLQPLSTQDKDSLVHQFLVENNFDFSAEGMTDYQVSSFLMSTPQYTVINGLEFLCLFFKNKSFRSNTINFAQSNYKINLNSPNFTQGFLMSLAEYFCYSRFLDNAAVTKLKAQWQDKSVSSSFELESFHKVCMWWVHAIIQSVQIYEMIDMSELKLTNSDKEDIFDSISHNDKLVQYYLEVRGIK